MKALMFLTFLFIKLSLSFACDLPGHFSFDVKNEEELLYSGCYDAINLGPHIIFYTLTKERAEAAGVGRPSVRFTRNRDGGVLQERLMEHGYSLPSHRDFSGSGFDRGHIAPNADFNDTYDNAVMTFFVANIWPQTLQLNRVNWLRTEIETRRLASEHSTVEVIITVDEFSDNYVGNIRIPLNFKRKVYTKNYGILLYDITVYQWTREITP